MGGGLHYDAVMEDAKITLEVIYDALWLNTSCMELS